MDSSKICAVMEIGSNSIYFRIMQRKNDVIEMLESIEYPLSLGKESFSTGKIEFEKVVKTCNLIEEFIELAKSYGVRVRDITAVATTAIREAKNRDYIVDQIKVKTGIELKILDDSEEKLYMYKEIIMKIKDLKELEKEAVMIAYIGSGSLGIAVYKKNRIIFSQNILIGTLKLSEILGDLKYKTDKLYIVIEDYMSSFTKMLPNILPEKNINNLIVSGSGIRFLRTQCSFTEKGDIRYFNKEDFGKVYNTVKDKNPEQLERYYSISEDRADMLLPSMGIYKSIMELTNADRILSPVGDLVDAVLYSEMFERESVELEEIIKESTVITAKNIAKRYFYDEEHAEFVERISLKIFDKMKKLHGMGERERLYLQLAAILHDIGKYINVKNHYKHSYNIIAASDILGLTDREINIIANIAKYHSRELPGQENKGYKGIEESERVMIAKLTAILRVADGLDRSHLQKVQEFEITIKGNEMTIVVAGDKNILIDEWTFIKKSKFMEEVFGIKTSIKKRGREI